MIPINDMQFTTVKKDGETTITGKLSFTQVHRMPNDEIASVKFDLVEHQKERMGFILWKKAYGDLATPINELCHHARACCEQGRLPRILELVEQINSLLQFAPTPLRPERDGREEKT